MEILNILLGVFVVIIFTCPLLGCMAAIIARSERWFASLAAVLAGILPAYAVIGGSRNPDDIAIVASPILFFIAALCFLSNRPTKGAKTASIVSLVGFSVSLIVMFVLGVSIPYS